MPSSISFCQRRIHTSSPAAFFPVFASHVPSMHPSAAILNTCLSLSVTCTPGSVSLCSTAAVSNQSLQHPTPPVCRSLLLAITRSTAHLASPGMLLGSLSPHCAATPPCRGAPPSAFRGPLACNLLVVHTDRAVTIAALSYGSRAWLGGDRLCAARAVAQRLTTCGRLKCRLAGNNVSQGSYMHFDDHPNKRLLYRGHSQLPCMYIKPHPCSQAGTRAGAAPWLLEQSYHRVSPSRRLPGHVHRLESLAFSVQMPKQAKTGE